MNTIKCNIFFFIMTWFLFSCAKPQNSSQSLPQVSEEILQEELRQVKADAGLLLLVKDSQVVVKTNLVLIDTVYRKGPQEIFSKSVNIGTLLSPVFLMLALDSISPTDTVDVGNGIYIRNGHRIEDHNANRGGYGVINTEQVIAFDSKIGVLKIMEKIKNLEQVFEANLRKMGFSTGLSPLEILQFYDRIARQDTSLCSPKVMKDMRNMLRKVVSDGTGKNLYREDLEIAGKTGASTNNMISCCAYFEIAGSTYTCLVIISNPKEGYPSGGIMCGDVIKELVKEIKKEGFAK